MIVFGSSSAGERKKIIDNSMLSLVKLTKVVLSTTSPLFAKEGKMILNQKKGQPTNVMMKKIKMDKDQATCKKSRAWGRPWSRVVGSGPTGLSS